MPELVHENERADQDDEVQRAHELERGRSLARPSAGAFMTERIKKTPAQSRVSLHHLMLPEHANALGNVHGGMIMRWVDEAGAICAMRHAQAPCVTVAIDSMTFQQPVHVGELLSCTG